MHQRSKSDDTQRHCCRSCVGLDVVTFAMYVLTGCFWSLLS